MDKKIEEVKKILHKRYGGDIYDVRNKIIAEEICQLFEPKPSGAVDIPEEARLTDKQMAQVMFNLPDYILDDPERVSHWITDNARKLCQAQLVKVIPLIEKRARGRLIEETWSKRPKIICLCGSSRFITEMAILAWNFEKEGAITMGLHLLPECYSDGGVIPDHLAEAENVAEKMDALHLKKIELADEVFIVNKNGYIGESTAREIAYATKLGKPVKYLEALKSSGE